VNKLLQRATQANVQARARKLIDEGASIQLIRLPAAAAAPFAGPARSGRAGGPYDVCANDTVTFIGDETRRRKEQDRCKTPPFSW